MKMETDKTERQRNETLIVYELVSVGLILSIREVKKREKKRQWCKQKKNKKKKRGGGEGRGRAGV